MIICSLAKRKEPKKKRRRRNESWRVVEGVIKIYGEIRVDRGGGCIWKERLKGGNIGIDQRIIGGSQISFFPAMPGQT